MLRPGAYRSVCVELEVHHLAVAAITSLDYLAGLEGGDGGAGGAGGAGGPPALKVLQRLVEGWLKEAVQHANP